MKIYKVYAQCVRGIKKTIQEIDKVEAENLICDAVNDMVDMEDIDVEGETDEEVNANFENLYTKAIEYFEENEYFHCGDFAVIASDEMPERSGSYGWTKEFI